MTLGHYKEAEEGRSPDSVSPSPLLTQPGYSASLYSSIMSMADALVQCMVPFCIAGRALSPFNFFTCSPRSIVGRPSIVYRKRYGGIGPRCCKLSAAIVHNSGIIKTDDHNILMEVVRT